MSRVRRGAIAAACVVLGSLVVGGAGDPGPSPIDVSVTVAPAPHSTLAALVTVTAGQPVRPTLVARGPGHEVVIPPPARAARVVEIALVGLRPKTGYRLSLTSGGTPLVADHEVAFRSGGLPDGMPALVVRATPRARPGYTAFNLMPNGGKPGSNDRGDPTRVGYVVITDETGAVVWYLETPGADVRQLPNGHLLFQYDHVGAREVDLLGNVVHEWTTAARLDHGVGAPVTPGAAVVDVPRLHHEVATAPDGSLIALTFDVRAVPGVPADRCPGPDPDRYKGDSLVEVARDGHIVRRIDIFDLVDPVARPGSEPCELHGDALVPGPPYVDWTHGNAVTVYPELNLVLYSARFLDAVLAIRWEADDDGPAGEVLWELGPQGDFRLTGGAWFSHQHAPELLDDHTILLYDNGNRRAGSVAVGGDDPLYSRAVMYTFDHSSLDRSEWTARQVWQHVDEEVGIPVYSSIVGDADDIGGGHVLVTNGAVMSTPQVALHGHISEVDRESGDVVLDLRTVPVGGGWSTFRAEHLDTLFPDRRTTGAP